MNQLYTFGAAIELMKDGERMARRGWNGKGMFIWFEKGSIGIGDVAWDDIAYNGVPLSLFDIGDAGTVTRMPHINMRAADGFTVVGWLASQSDMLAEDWVVVGD